jgi:hypothetical protein
MADPIRQVLVPDLAFEEATVTSNSQQGRRAPMNTERVTSVAWLPSYLSVEAGQEGDVRPSFSGTPEDDESYEIEVSHPGSVGCARFSIVPPETFKAETNETNAPGRLNVKQSPLIVGQRVDAIEGKITTDDGTFFVCRPRSVVAGDNIVVVAPVLQYSPYDRYVKDPENGPSASAHRTNNWTRIIRVARLDTTTQTWTSPSGLADGFIQLPNYTIGTSSPILKTVGILGLEYFEDVDHLVLVTVFGDLDLRNDSAVVTYFSEDLGDSWKVDKVSYISRGGKDINRNYEDIIKHQYQNSAADDSSFSGVIEFSNQYEGVDSATYDVIVVKSGVVGLPNTPEEDCARIAWTLNGTFISPLNRAARWNKGGRMTHMGKGVSVHTIQSIDRRNTGIVYGSGAITASFKFGDYVAFEYGSPTTAVADAWSVNKSASSADPAALSLLAENVNFRWNPGHKDAPAGFADGDRIYMTFLESGWPGFTYQGKGMKFASQFASAASGDSYVPVTSPSELDAGVPVYSGQSILLRDSSDNSDYGVSVTFFHDQGGNDLEVNEKYSCFYDPRSYFHDLDCARTRSNRLVVPVLTSTSLFVMYSDNRGCSWQSTTLHQFEENLYSGGCSVTRLSNGTLVLVASPTLGWNPNTEAEAARWQAPEQYEFFSQMWLSSDGEIWSGPLLLSNFEYGNAIERKVVERADGFPMLLSQVHYVSFESATADGDAIEGNKSVVHDAIWQQSFATRFPKPGDDLDTLLPYPLEDYSTPKHAQWPFVTVNDGLTKEGVQEGVYPVSYWGHAYGLCGVSHRGRTLVMSCYGTGEGQGESYPTDWTKGDYEELTESRDTGVIHVMPTNYWHDVQERITWAGIMTPGITEGSWAPYNFDGRHYQLSWDTGILPTSAGWSVSGASGSTLHDVEEDGGFLRISVEDGDGQIYYDTSLPNPLGAGLASSPYESLTRFVFRPQLGGSLDYSEKDDYVNTLLVLRDQGQSSPTIGWEIRARSDSGAGTTTVRLFDMGSGLQIGSDVVFSQTTPWLEVLVGTNSRSGTGTSDVRCDAVIRTLEDRDFEYGFEIIAEDESLTVSDATSLGAERIQFGVHAPASSDFMGCDWKAVHLNRGLYLLEGSSGTTRGRLSFFSGTDPVIESVPFFGVFNGLTQNDAGISNYPSPCRTSEKPLWARAGISASWAGEVSGRVRWSFDPEYQYPVTNASKQPVQAKYRSALETDAVGGADALAPYVRAAATQVAGIAADGIALFGNNFPFLTVYYTNPGPFFANWYTIGVPIEGFTPDYDCSLWSAEEPTDTISVDASDGSNLVFTVNGSSPGWRPHQFYSHASGVKHYVAFSSRLDSEIRVAEIVDNTEDTLILESSVDASDLPVPLGVLGNDFVVSIYSDRFAASTGISGRYQSYTIDTGLTFVTGTPEASVINSYGVLFYPSTKRYWELGRVMLGRWFDINNPYIDWGFTYDHTTGYTSQSTSSKARFSKRQSTITRKVTASFDFLHYDVRTESTRAVEATRTWQHMIDLLRRLEIDGRPCALVWEATEEDDTFFNGDPFEVLCVRAEIGNSTHTMYNNRTGSNSVCSPKPIMSLSGLAFTEED